MSEVIQPGDMPAEDAGQEVPSEAYLMELVKADIYREATLARDPRQAHVVLAVFSHVAEAKQALLLGDTEKARDRVTAALSWAESLLGVRHPMESCEEAAHDEPCLHLGFEALTHIPHRHVIASHFWKTRRLLY